MRHLYAGFLGGFRGIGLLILRFVVGLAFVLHGLPKLQSPFHWMDQMPSPAPPIFQGLAAFAEVGGGLALIVGLLTPIAAFGIACNMTVALAMVHLPAGHPFVAKPGEPSYEGALVYLAIMLGLILLGPGAYSLDALLWGEKDRFLEARSRRMSSA